MSAVGRRLSTVGLPSMKAFNHILLKWYNESNWVYFTIEQRADECLIVEDIFYVGPLFCDLFYLIPSYFHDYTLLHNSYLNKFSTSVEGHPLLRDFLQKETKANSKEKCKNLSLNFVLKK